VYLLLNPLKNDEPFYIGKGKGKRVKDHYTPGYLKQNNHKSNIINLYRSKGYEDKYLILKDGMTNQEAYDWETWFILEMYGMKKAGGLLVNQTTGGGGSPGFAAPRTDEWREKISKGNKGKKRTSAQNEANSKRTKARGPHPNVGEKISKALKGIPKAPEHVDKVRKALLGRTYPGRVYLREGKTYNLISPYGKLLVVTNLSEFCKINNLSVNCMYHVVNGRASNHKGWKLGETIN
jgi:hypothetical protein